jgi:hypothetical protein
VLRDTATYDFLSPRAGSDEAWCDVHFELGSGHGELRLGYGPCPATDNQPPRCSVRALWQKAEAQGLPAAAQHAVLNHIGHHTWHFMVEAPSELEYDLDDDCP